MMSATADEDSPYRVILDRMIAFNPTLLTDEGLIQALLLVLVAKQKHLIVRTPESEVPKVLKQTVNILHKLFNLSVVKLNLHRSDKLSPEAFLRLFFLEKSTAPRAASHKISQETSSAAGKPAPVFKRSSTYPIGPAGSEKEAIGGTETEFLPASPATQASTISEEFGYCRSLVRTQTEPGLHEIQHQHQDLILNPFPQVLAVSGLEDCSDQVQKALWTTMSTGKIPLDADAEMPGVMRTLPEDFFVVYVCPYGDPCGRVPVHRSLLDRFAMSTEVFPATKSASENTRTLMTESDLRPKTVLSASDIADLRMLASPSHTILHEKLDLYLSDLFSAARHHPHLDGVLLTVRSREDTMALLRVWRVLFGPAQSRLDHMLDVTDEDVRRVFIKTVQHRLRVLEGPQHELLASLVFVVSDKSTKDAEWETGRRGVKEILKEIIDTV